MRKHYKKASAIKNYLDSGRALNPIKGLFQKSKKLPSLGPKNLINPLYEGDFGISPIKRLIKK